MDKKNHDPDPRPGSYFRELKTIFWVKLRKFFDADQRSEMEKFGSGMEKLRSGIKKNPGSVTLGRTNERIR
jgi:hypothetical protein